MVPEGTCHLAAPAENDKRWKRETTKSFPDAKAEKTALRDVLERPMGLTDEIAQYDLQELSCKTFCNVSKRLLESILETIS